MYLILSVVLSTLCTMLFQYRKSFKGKIEKERRKEKEMGGRMKEDNNGNYIPNSLSFFDKKKNKNTSLTRRRFEKKG